MLNAPQVIGTVIDSHLTGATPNRAPLLITGTINGADIVRASAQARAGEQAFVDLTTNQVAQDLSGRTVYLSLTPAELAEALDSIADRDFPQALKGLRDQSRVPQERVDELAKILEAIQNAESVTLVIDITQPSTPTQMDVALAFAENRKFGNIFVLPDFTSVAFVADQNTSSLRVSLRNRTTWLPFDSRGELISMSKATRLSLGQMDGASSASISKPSSPKP